MYGAIQNINRRSQRTRQPAEGTENTTRSKRSVSSPASPNKKRTDGKKLDQSQFQPKSIFGRITAVKKNIALLDHKNWIHRANTLLDLGGKVRDGGMCDRTKSGKFERTENAELQEKSIEMFTDPKWQVTVDALWLLQFLIEKKFMSMEDVNKLIPIVTKMNNKGCWQEKYNASRLLILLKRVKLEKLNEQNSAQIEANTKLEESASKLKEQIESATSESKGKESELQKHKEDLKELTQQINQSKSELIDMTELTSEIDNLESGLESMKVMRIKHKELEFDKDALLTHDELLMLELANKEKLEKIKKENQIKDQDLKSKREEKENKEIEILSKQQNTITSQTSNPFRDTTNEDTSSEVIKE